MDRRPQGDPDAGGPAAEFVDTPENTPGDDEDLPEGPATDGDAEERPD